MPAKPQNPPSWPPTPAATLRSDVDLLSRIKRREPEALGELYDQYGRLAYSVILRIVGDENKAEDLLAESLVTVWNQIARWRDARIEDLRLWFLLLAREHALDYLRSRNESLPKALPHPAALTQPSVLQDFPRPRNIEQWLQLQKACSALTQKESRILEMAGFDGKPIAEIAVTLGESVNSIREAINQAVRKLSIA